MKILLTTIEGYRKDNTLESKKKHADRPFRLNFNGTDAPLKAVRAMMQKFGITKEDL